MIEISKPLISLYLNDRLYIILKNCRMYVTEQVDTTCILKITKNGCNILI